ncbi:hypothetical protein KBX37_16935 [Micromonospora sp. U56]|uniref:hypothetical protein n=1 Tax=Micromonospora sp. U56 TaxID=2824900 RepID=UPI001B377453|nr:hypothetical protein [Micromonospora sp. U56]MBQ0894765.1 hypothetical protein [Micromonospora sp. U56]
MTSVKDVSDWRKYLLVCLPIFAVVGLFNVGDLVPAWRAKSGNGTVGVFTAEREQCRKRVCNFYGSWKASDGSATRSDVILYDDPDGLRLDGTVEAIDSGHSKGVFASAGGSTYLTITGMTVAGAAAVVGWVYVVIRTVRARRRRPVAA